MVCLLGSCATARPDTPGTACTPVETASGGGSLDGPINDGLQYIPFPAWIAVAGALLIVGGVVWLVKKVDTARCEAGPPIQQQVPVGDPEAVALPAPEDTDSTSLPSPASPR